MQENFHLHIEVSIFYPTHRVDQTERLEFKMKITYPCLLVTILALSGEGWATPSVGKSQSETKTNPGDLCFIIENENKKNLDLLIKPEVIPNNSDASKQLSHDPKAGWLAFTVPACAEESKSKKYVVKVVASQLGDSQYYSITGETNPVTPIGTCYNLEPGKCYKVRFTNNAFGTDCISTEIKGKIPHLKDALKIVPLQREIPCQTDEEKAGPPERPSEVLIPTR